MRAKLKITFVALTVIFIALVAVTPQTYAQPLDISAVDATRTSRPSRTPRPTRTPILTRTPTTLVIEIVEEQIQKALKPRIPSTVDSFTVEMKDGELIYTANLNVGPVDTISYHFKITVERNKLQMHSLSVTSGDIVVTTEELLAERPSAKSTVNYINRLFTSVVTQQLVAKVKGRYTIQSAIFVQDKLIITISK
jgi:hypothetical protein